MTDFRKPVETGVDPIQCFNRGTLFNPLLFAQILK